MTERKTRCHYYRPTARELCADEAVDPEAEVLLCSKHLARAMQLVQQRMAEVRAENQATLS